VSKEETVATALITFLSETIAVLGLGDAFRLEVTTDKDQISIFYSFTENERKSGMNQTIATIAAESFRDPNIGDDIGLTMAKIVVREVLEDRKKQEAKDA
tara:strand:+ start:361 stop:660 length:300 start_codon:yes stop_codon:yes gene_type:complete